MAARTRVVYDDRPIAWYAHERLTKAHALARTEGREAEWLDPGEESLGYTGEWGQGDLRVKAEPYWWFKFKIELPT